MQVLARREREEQDREPSLSQGNMLPEKLRGGGTSKRMALLLGAKYFEQCV